MGLEQELVGLVEALKANTSAVMANSVVMNDNTTALAALTAAIEGNPTVGFKATPQPPTTRP